MPDSSTENSIRTDLPHPDDLPDCDVVIFDGDCQFCSRQVKNLAKWDGGGRLSFLSLHDPEVARRWPDLQHDELMKEMYVIRPCGQRYSGADAARYLSRRLPRLWWAAPILNFPFAMPLWRFMYRWIAKRRYKWNKSTADGDCKGSCSVHFDQD